ncbi:MAG: 2,3-bisphosphoglycerate-independent phosphoglycerate mutase [Oscillospiraceae bacterium]|jgi:2,3-bisphosphoglycerate-independent phosphoglycerate mutase|nr:2,3-bisphosphoglycerate-independent phosphoglycerate mutase [Oscillospiraceae bacterium]
MKYILIIGDGMADNPVPELGELTPLEYLSEKGEKPAIDLLASRGILGRVKNCPDGLPAGSDTAIMSIFGCDPNECYTGRAPLEAAATGIKLNAGDIAYRCNMVTISDNDAGEILPEPTDFAFERRRMLSHSAGSIDGGLSERLVSDLFSDPEFKKLAQEAGMAVNPAQSFRHIAVQSGVKDGAKNIVLNPPHNFPGSPVGEILPSGNANAKTLAELQRAAYLFLDRHPINLELRRAGKYPANCVWFWAEGTAVELPSFTKQYGKTGGVVSAVPLCHGIANLIGLEPIFVDGATGELDTNYEGKVDAAISALRDHPFAAIHVEAPDECTHNGDLPGKLEAIRRLDGLVVRDLLEKLGTTGWDFRILILSDHKTLTSTRGHDGTPVPYAIYDSRFTEKSTKKYTETSADGGELIPEGTRLMSLLFDDEFVSAK